MELAHRSSAVRAVCDHTTRELLAIAIHGGRRVPDLNLDRIAQAIDDGQLVRAVANPDQLRGLAEMPLDIAGFLGVAFELARRAALAGPPAAIGSAADLSLLAQRELGGRTRECVMVIACDAANRVIRTEIVSRGSADSAPVPVREILNAVLRCDGRAFAVAHNHPASVLDTSDADVTATERVAAAARTVGLRFLGHVVVAADQPKP